MQGWTSQEVITMVVAIVGGIFGIIGSVQGSAAKSQADAHEVMMSKMTQRLDSYGKQITSITANMKTATMTAPQMPVGMPTAQTMDTAVVTDSERADTTSHTYSFQRTGFIDANARMFQGEYTSFINGVSRNELHKKGLKQHR